MKVKIVMTLMAAMAGEPLFGQSRPALPFEAYRVALFGGKPAVPVIFGEYEALYRQEIIDGVVMGYGVWRDGVEKPGVNFAGHYVVIRMSAGAPGLRMAIVDALTGTILYPPLSIHGIGVRNFDLPLLQRENSVARNPSIEFRADSRLMVITASVAGVRAPAEFYYELGRRGWKLVRRLDQAPRPSKSPYKRAAH